MKTGQPDSMTHGGKRHGTATLFADLNDKVIGRHGKRHRNREFLNQIDQTAPADPGIPAGPSTSRRLPAPE